MTESYSAAANIKTDERLLKLKDYLINAVNPEMQKQSTFKQPGREAVRQLLIEALDRTKVELPGGMREQVLNSALADLIGYGPLEPLLADEETSEIMVNGPGHVFVERNGEVLETDVHFDDDEHLLRIIDQQLKG